jgi:sec-independent protein translocase protein TatB
MFEVGFSEILLIVVIALIVLGPHKLPKLAADIGRWVGRARAMARQLSNQLNEEINLEKMAQANDIKNAKSATPPAPAAPPMVAAIAAPMSAEGEPSIASAPAPEPAAPNASGHERTGT